MSARLLPVRPRRRFVFMLTPLVDVMFLLLIFFMLSSQTSPYALLKVSAEAGGGAAPPEAVPNLEFVVSVGDGFARLNGRRVALVQLAAAVDEAMARGFEMALVTTGPTATVQDLVSVLDVFRRQGFPSTRLIGQPEAGR